jgi:hypothetical protein
MSISQWDILSHILEWLGGWKDKHFESWNQRKQIFENIEKVKLKLDF